MQTNQLTKLMELSKTWHKENRELNCNIVLREDNKKYHAYSVSICNRGLLFFCKEGCLDYVIDTIGSMDYLSLISIGE